MEPMVIARLLQLAAVKPGETALVVAAGAGYGAALLAACGAQVTALEEDAALLDLARQVLPEFAPAVNLVQGSLLDGWKAAAPYDLVLIDGAVEFVPDAIAAQVKLSKGGSPGRVVTVLSRGGRIGHGAIGEPVGAGLGAAGPGAVGAGAVSLRFQPVFDCATPLLPAFRRPPDFVF
jgi:protein-L-isoaspartate(D-aspartate) O-methyltransferase